jgi:hypothetical protein
VYSALMMRKEKREMLENINEVVAERMSFVDDYIQSYKLNEKCQKHIFPVFSPTPYYKGPLLLTNFGGVFVFIISLLSLSLFVFLLEMISVRRVQKEEVLQMFRLPEICYDNRISFQARELIEKKYAEIRSIIDNGDKINMLY